MQIGTFGPPLVAHDRIHSLLRRLGLNEVQILALFARQPLPTAVSHGGADHFKSTDLLKWLAKVDAMDIEE